MLFTTPTQWLALAVALIAGWLFGLASHPGGRKWKQRYADERDIHGRNRKEFDARLAERDARIAELERENDGPARSEFEARLADRDARIKELERDNDRLASALPTAPPIAPVTTTRTDGRRITDTQGRWFDWTNRADTTR